MSPLARILLQRGDTVSGSDQQESPVTRSLADLGVTIHGGHNAANVSGADLVVASAAIRPDNPELREAAARGIRTVTGAALLGELMEGKRGICVAGTHGKTTTTAMIALVLTRAGLDPTYVIGGEPLDLPASGQLGSGEHFVAEADEFGGRFLSLHPWIAVVTSLEPDHPDCYPTMDDLEAAFRTLRRPGPARRLAGVLRRQRSRRRSWPGDPARDWFLTGWRAAKTGTRPISAPTMWAGSPSQQNTVGKNQGKVQLRVPGRAQREQCAGRPGSGDAGRCGAATGHAPPWRTSAVWRRRFEVVGEALGATLIDDYAHHPSEIRATLAGARQRYPGRRIVALHQPHTYSRLKALLPDFAGAFGDADQVLIVDIYASRETDTLGVHARDLAAAIVHPDARYAGSLEDAVRRLTDQPASGRCAGQPGRRRRQHGAEPPDERRECRDPARPMSRARGQLRTAHPEAGRLDSVGSLIRQGEPMSRHTTLRIGGPAEYFAEAATEAELAALLGWAESREHSRHGSSEAAPICWSVTRAWPGS